MAQPNGFDRIIQTLPKNLKVLDVGAGGLGGDNTTNAILSHFGYENYHGVCINPERAKVYKNEHPEVGISIGDFYEQDYENLDLIVLDLDVANNVNKDWSEEGLERVRGMLREGGYLINYVICTLGYGDPGETPDLIHKGWKDFWDMEELSYEKIGDKLHSLKGWELYMTAQEERRPYILWTCLRKTSGK